MYIIYIHIFIIKLSNIGACYHWTQLNRIKHDEEISTQTHNIK